MVFVLAALTTEPIYQSLWKSGIGFDGLYWHSKAKWSYYPCECCLIHWKFPWLEELSAQLICCYISVPPLGMDTRDCWTWRARHSWSFAFQLTRLIIPSLLLYVGSFVCLFLLVSLVLLFSEVRLSPDCKHKASPATATSWIWVLISAVSRKLLPVTMSCLKARGI